MNTNDAITPNHADDIPDWLRVYREDNYLPSVDESTARDPDYIAARIQDILDTATGIGADVRARLAEQNPTIDGERAQQNAVRQALHEYLQRFIEEIRPHGREGDAAFARLIATNPQLHWGRVRNGFLGMSRWNAESDETESCALGLGLAEKERRDGRREWRGAYGEWRIRVVGDANASTPAGEQ
ncbi:hypothetical protein ACIBG0_38760 [Nocardia sp. NPDC050630]|uniref:hypothetical protein n=1 Tax=Nocardia sp. NPDC050630 TaxID=3364321 RepID=UPI003789393C